MHVLVSEMSHFRAHRQQKGGVFDGDVPDFGTPPTVGAGFGSRGPIWHFECHFGRTVGMAIVKFSRGPCKFLDRYGRGEAEKHYLYGAKPESK